MRGKHLYVGSKLPVTCQICEGEANNRRNARHGRRNIGYVWSRSRRQIRAKEEAGTKMCEKHALHLRWPKDKVLDPCREMPRRKTRNVGNVLCLGWPEGRDARHMPGEEAGTKDAKGPNICRAWIGRKGQVPDRDGETKTKDIQGKEHRLHPSVDKTSTRSMQRKPRRKGRGGRHIDRIRAAREAQRKKHSRIGVDRRAEVPDLCKKMKQTRNGRGIIVSEWKGTR